MRQFATFTLGRSLFGVEVLLVREINRLMEVTPIPQSPPYVLGMINLRGHVATILDLGVRLNLRTSGQGASHQVILKSNEELAATRNAWQRQDLMTCADTVGFMVEEICDVVDVEDHEVEPVPAGHEGVEGELLQGVVMLDKRLMSILNVERVLHFDNPGVAGKAG
jgi:purine-binding chemotaxis protein CheW